MRLAARPTAPPNGWGPLLSGVSWSQTPRSPRSEVAQTCDSAARSRDAPLGVSERCFFATAGGLCRGGHGGQSDAEVVTTHCHPLLIHQRSFPKQGRRRPRRPRLGRTAPGLLAAGGSTDRGPARDTRGDGPRRRRSLGRDHGGANEAPRSRHGPPKLVRVGHDQPMSL